MAPNICHGFFHANVGQMASGITKKNKKSDNFRTNVHSIVLYLYSGKNKTDNRYLFDLTSKFGQEVVFMQAGCISKLNLESKIKLLKMKIIARMFLHSFSH